MIIDRLPPFTQRFFRRFQPSLSKPQFVHLWSLVLGIAVNLRAAKLVHLRHVMNGGAEKVPACTGVGKR